MALTIQGTPGASAATTITIPTHAVGDIIVICAYRGSNALASKPSASGTVPTWTDIDAATGANTNSMRTAYTVATASNHTSGTWTNASCLAVIVLRGQAASPVGGHAESGSTATTGVGVAPSVTMSRSDGSSALLHFFGITLQTSWAAAPAGYTQRATAGSNGFAAICLDTKNSTTSDGSVSQGSAVNSTGYRGATVEVLALATRRAEILPTLAVGRASLR